MPIRGRGRAGMVRKGRGRGAIRSESENSSKTKAKKRDIYPVYIHCYKGISILLHGIHITQHPKTAP